MKNSLAIEILKLFAWIFCAWIFWVFIFSVFTPQTKEKVEDKVEKAAADTVEKITRKAVKGAGAAKTVAKAVTKTATKTVKKAAKKDIIIKAFVEYYGKQVEEKDIIARVKKAWTRSGKKVGDIKEMDLYIKPEENAVYYVINGTETGAVEFE